MLLSLLASTALAASITFPSLMVGCEGEIWIADQPFACTPPRLLKLDSGTHVAVHAGHAEISGPDGKIRRVEAPGSWVAPALERKPPQSLVDGLLSGFFGGPEVKITKGGRTPRRPPVADLDQLHIDRDQRLLPVVAGDFEAGTLWIRVERDDRPVGTATALVPGQPNLVSLAACEGQCTLVLLQFDYPQGAGSPSLSDSTRLLLDAEPSTVVAAWSARLSRIDCPSSERAAALTKVEGFGPVPAAGLLAAGGWLFEARARLDPVPGGLAEPLSGWWQEGLLR